MVLSRLTLKRREHIASFVVCQLSPFPDSKSDLQLRCGECRYSFPVYSSICQTTNCIGRNSWRGKYKLDHEKKRMHTKERPREPRMDTNTIFSWNGFTVFQELHWQRHLRFLWNTATCEGSTPTCYSSLSHRPPFHSLLPPPYLTGAHSSLPSLPYSLPYSLDSRQRITRSVIAAA